MINLKKIALIALILKFGSTTAEPPALNLNGLGLSETVENDLQRICRFSGKNFELRRLMRRASER